MKILELRSENIKNLKAIEIIPDPSVNVLSGPNGAGKSAILDSIMMALTGQTIEQPIRNGTTRAEIEINMGDYLVKRIYTHKGMRLEVKSPDGVAKTSPQDLLNKIMGKLTFDPLAFSRQRPKDQRQLLADLVGLSTADIDLMKEAAYDKRTEINRRIEHTKAVLASYEKPDDNLPDEEISTEKLMAALTDLGNRDAKHREWVAYIKHHEALLVNKKAEINRIQDQIDQLQIAMAKAQKEAKDLVGCLAEAKEPEIVDLAAIKVAKDELLQAGVKNRKIQQKAIYLKNLADLSTLANESEELTREITDLEEQRTARVSAAKFPIEGLSLTDEFVVYQGKPFSQLSTGEQVRASTAMAMAMNPKVKVILIREGSLLDQLGKDTIFQMARDKDYQVWMESVNDKGNATIMIEDGAIVEKEAV